jgi:aspartyl-tRNA(Asn)/glutamyl-tRNA(Gln) amidotransferase subunit C
MPLNTEHVEYVARLSRLELTEEEKGRFAAQLDSILGFIEKLNELDTEDVEPLVHIAPERNVFREDSVGDSLSREDATRNAPSRRDGLFQVPRIIG